MRYSPNLNIIIKAIEKVSNFVLRDFMELENLQNNPNTADRFANACYNKVKKNLISDLQKMRPEYDIHFSDGDKIKGTTDKAEYIYKIVTIDGIENLTRANSDFTIAIALEHITKNGEKETIAAAIAKVIGNELYYCDKGFGSYVNNRRIRISKRSSGSNLVVVTKNPENTAKKFVGKNVSTRNYGSDTLAIAYTTAGKIDGINLEASEFVLPFLLLIKEAGGNFSEKGGIINSPEIK